MVCLGSKPWTAGWKTQTNPLSWRPTNAPKLIGTTIGNIPFKSQFYNILNLLQSRFPSKKGL